jgi:anti-anti-sigma factor
VAQAEFKQALDGAQADSDRVILDLGALTLIDCACLFVVFSAAKRTRREGGLVLLNPQGQVRRVLALIGIPNGAVVTKYL